MIFLSCHAANLESRDTDLINQLINYRETIYALYRKKIDRAKYDVKFRKYVANLTLPRYDIRLPDLMDECDYYKRVYTGNNLMKTGNTSGTSSGILSGRGMEQRSGDRKCHAFQKGLCERKLCRFEHKCRKCNSPEHGEAKCKKN